MFMTEKVESNGNIFRRPAIGSGEVARNRSLRQADSVHPAYRLCLGEEVEWFVEPVIVGYYAGSVRVPLLALGLSNAIQPPALEGLVVQFASDDSPLLLWAKMLKFSQPFPFEANKAGLAELRQRYQLREH
ncbi:MAG: hypothetical protein ACRYG7_39540 [Janthinobacterium lividum]